jgi:succinate-acetate transporter protein
VLRVFAVIPIVGLPIYGLMWIWMLVTTVVAVRQALDYTSTARAVGVCIIGWALSFVLAAIIGTLMAPSVS